MILNLVLELVVECRHVAPGTRLPAGQNPFIVMRARSFTVCTLTVNLVITHTVRGKPPTMGYYRVWVLGEKWLQTSILGYQNCMGYHGVWVIPCMAYNRVDCILMALSELTVWFPQVPRYNALRTLDLGQTIL
jgi:hypothetical protein